MQPTSNYSSESIELAESYESQFVSFVEFG